MSASGPKAVARHVRLTTGDIYFIDSQLCASYSAMFGSTAPAGGWTPSLAWPVLRLDRV